MFRTIGVAALLLSVAGPALAHPDHDVSGFLHPFTGIDHLLAMVGGGVWASLLATRKPVTAVLVPVAFVLMMAVGAGAGFSGIKLPLTEAVILASVFVVGGLLVGAVRLSTGAAMAIVGLFAVFHGYAHALEAPAAETGGYILGFLAGTSLLQLFGLGLGWVAQRTVGVAGFRALGGVVMAGGALVLITQ